MARIQFVNPPPFRKYEITVIFINDDGNKECVEKLCEGDISFLVQRINKEYHMARIADINEVV